MSMPVRTRVLLAAASILLMPFDAPARAAEAYDISVIVPMTGGASFFFTGSAIGWISPL